MPQNITIFGRKNQPLYTQNRPGGPERKYGQKAVFDALAAEGTLQSQVPQMQTRARLYELVDYAAYSEFDEGVFTFDLSTNRSQ